MHQILHFDELIAPVAVTCTYPGDTHGEKSSGKSSGMLRSPASFFSAADHMSLSSCASCTSSCRHEYLTLVDIYVVDKQVVNVRRTRPCRSDSRRSTFFTLPPIDLSMYLALYRICHHFKTWKALFFHGSHHVD